MVPIHRFGIVRLKILSGNQLPPHFHVDTPEGELSVDMETGDAKGSRAA
ncbi:MAG: hypothetical protein ACOZEN_09960 [Thermodesulfobacteriota bacterium]